MRKCYLKLAHYQKRNKNIMIETPKNWERKTLGEIGDFSKGNGISGEQLRSTGIPCVCYGDLYTKYDTKFCIPKNFTDKNAIKESTPINKGTLLFTATGETAEEIGKCVCYYGEENIYVGGDIFILQTKDINPLFVAYQQNLSPFIKQKARFGQGHSVVHIRLESIKKISVVYPKSLSEQQRIVKILAKWDEAIELQELLIEKFKIQKKGLMKKLLMPKKDWKKPNNTKIRLIDLCSGKPLYGLNEAATDDITLPRYLRITDINDNGNYVYQGAHVHCEDDVYILKRNDIVFARTGASVGKSYLYNEADGELAFAGFLIKFSIDPKKADSSFISYCCNTKEYWKWVEINCARSGQPGINAEEYSSLSLPYFDFAQKEQKKIADILNKLDIETHLHSQKLELFKKQRKALMQLLLTGTVLV